MRILIAEDEIVSRQMLDAFLRRWGHEPILATDGNEAWKILQQENPPAMAILDWMMPGLEGPEVTRRLREREAGGSTSESIYVVLLTAKETAADIVEGFSAGVDDYVTKPFNRDELRARVSVGVRMVELRQKLAGRVHELEIALKKVETLQGLLPICSYCKKIREDSNYWTDVESYIERFSTAEFSHGVCPECYDKHLRPRLDELRRERRESLQMEAPGGPAPAPPAGNPAAPAAPAPGASTETVAESPTDAGTRS